MENLLFYLLLLIASLASCFVGFYEEILRSNIRHLENGREPNAGAALLPAIPVIPAVHFGIVFGLNLLRENLGWYVIAGYFCLAAAYRLHKIPQLNRQFKNLNAQQNQS